MTRTLLISAILFATSASGLMADEPVANKPADQSATTPIPAAADNDSVSTLEKIRMLAAKSRAKRTQDEFADHMKRAYPESYNMIVELNPENQKTVFNSYKSGDRMYKIRRQIIRLYASQK